MISSGSEDSESKSAGIDLQLGKEETGTPEINTLSSRFLPLLILFAAFVARLYEASAYFLNPDEALHNLLATQSSIGLAYKAALTNAHPPLLILVLYYWHTLGHSELVLRLPSVLAGTASCWLMYQWLKQITNRSIALTGLLLFAFAPALIALSAEVRQYALLLFFMSACLYLSERALRAGSVFLMTLFSASLYGALLTHYSSFLFAFSVGAYLLLRLYPFGKNLKLFAAWGAGQACGVAIAVYFLATHVAHLKQSGMVQGIAETWLRKSIFHAGENNLAVFVAAQTLRVFTFLFSHGAIGTLALAAFLLGIFFLVKKTKKDQPQGTAQAPLLLALFLVLPFVVNCAAAVAGLYPYGGTRHDAFLSLFAVAGASIGLSAWNASWAGTKPLILLFCLAVCNFFPAPPPLIRARNHGRTLMKDAVNSLRQSAPPGSIVFADYQSGLLLGYYLCGKGVVQTFPPLQPFWRSDCGPYTAITARPQEWKFYAKDLQDQLASAVRIYGIAPGTKVWFFDAGWITDSAPALRMKLHERGCASPNNFGENILVCEIVVGNKESKESME